MIFMNHDVDKAITIKLLLSTFEQLSGLKINFHKSEIFCFIRSYFVVRLEILLSLPWSTYEN